MIQSSENHNNNVSFASHNVFVEFKQEIRVYLQENLPDYMIPTQIYVLDALPTTASGKVDYQALPIPQHDLLEAQPECILPRTEVEKVLADIWSKVLAIEQVGVEDNFFQIGGHSLLVTQIIARIREAFQVELPLLVFFETPTIAMLTTYIETIRWIKQDNSFSLEGHDAEREEGEI